MVKVQSYIGNPILKPNKRNKWEAAAVFNGSVVKEKGKSIMVYRALSDNQNIEDKNLQLSTIGISESSDGHLFKNRKCLIRPEESWEKYGCEDPRITKFSDDYYIFYTALGDFPPGPTSIKVGVAVSRDLKKFEKHLVTPFNAKAMALFPELINGKMAAILTVNTDMPPAKIAIAYFEKHEDIWDHDYWRKWYQDLDKHELKLKRLTTDQTEVGAVPVKTDEGWLLIYSHIENYFSGAGAVFGIEAVLLDKNDPQKVIGRTREPLMVPQEDYEMQGMVSNIVFPTGAVIEENDLLIYYGGADTVMAVAKCNLKELLAEVKKNGQIPRLTRAAENPVIVPRKEVKWEARAAFNPAAVLLNGKVHIIYRAMSLDNTSVLGYACSSDGITMDDWPIEPVYIPREDYETKKSDNGFSGCEDPRLTQMGEKIYMCYTAYDGITPPKIAMTSIHVNDFLLKKWNWSKPKIISDPSTDNKDGCLFPEMINDKYVFCHRCGGKGIIIDYVENLEFGFNEYLDGVACIRNGTSNWDDLKIGIAAPPIKTEKGWLLLYHGVSSVDHGYRLGAMLLELNDPTHILGITKYPLLEPEIDYEKFGEVNNVVFPCGAVVKKGKLYVYYGGADKVIGVAMGDVEEIVRELLYS